MIQADTPPPPMAAEVVVARDDHSSVAATLDLPLTLIKDGQKQEMLVRRALFLTVQTTQVRPKDGAADGSADHYRWKLASYLQRQYCVRALAGVFTCTTPETEPLPDKAEGEAPVAGTAGFPLAAAAEQALFDGLKARADALFAADRTAAVDPMLKAAGVKIVGASPAHAPRR